MDLCRFDLNEEYEDEEEEFPLFRVDVRVFFFSSSGTFETGGPADFLTDSSPTGLWSSEGEELERILEVVVAFVGF